MVVVKKFSATWCGPCRALAPVMNEIKTIAFGWRCWYVFRQNHQSLKIRCKIFIENQFVIKAQ